MKPIRCAALMGACVLFLSSCQPPQSVPPWQNEPVMPTTGATDSPDSTTDGPAPTKGASSPTFQGITYRELYDTYVKKGQTITIDYSGQQIEVLVEVVGSEGAIVSCPVVVGVDEINIVKPMGQKEKDAHEYLIALQDERKADTNSDQYNTNADVRKAIDKLRLEEIQRTRLEFGYKYDWQVIADDRENCEIKKLPQELRATQKLAFQTSLEDEKARELADDAVKRATQARGVENTFLMRVHRSLTQWKSRWMESLRINYTQLFDGMGVLVDFQTNTIPVYATDAPCMPMGMVGFDDIGVTQELFQLYKIVRRTAQGDNLLLAPEQALEMAIRQMQGKGGSGTTYTKLRPVRIRYGYYPMNAVDGVDYKKGEWMLVPLCEVDFFNTVDMQFARWYVFNALTGESYNPN